MTTIVAIKEGNRVVMGCDSKVTDETGAWWSHPLSKKIMQRGEIIIGGSGDCEPLDIALHIWQPPKTTVADRKDIYRFVITKLLPSLKQCFKDNDYQWRTDSSEPKFNFLIALCGEVFEFQDDFGIVMRESGIHGIGSGSQYALGALHAGATVTQALEIAAAHDTHTGAPFYLFSQ